MRKKGAASRKARDARMHRERKEGRNERKRRGERYGGEDSCEDSEASMGNFENPCLYLAGAEGGGWRGESSRTVGMARTNAENVGGRLRIVGDSQAEHSSNGYNLDDLMSVGRLWVRSPMRRERVTLESRTLSRRGSACNESNAEDSANRV